MNNIPTIPILYDSTVWELNTSMKYICYLQKLMLVVFGVFFKFCNKPVVFCTEMDPDVTCSAGLEI